MANRVQTWWQDPGRRYRLLVALALALLALAVVAGLVIRRAAPNVSLPFIGPDPWPTAIAQTQQVLSANPDFESRMRWYREEPATIDGYLDVVDKARTASTVINDLHTLQIPLVGNAWQALIKALNVVPGGGAALEGLDDNLKQVLALKGQLASVRDADAVAVAVQTFKENPSKDTLVAMAGTMAYYSSVLSQANEDLQPHRAAVSNAATRVRNVQQSLQRAQDAVSRVPLLPDAVARLNTAIGGLFNPLLNLEKALDDLHAHFQTDIATMQQMQGIVATAQGGTPQPTR